MASYKSGPMKGKKKCKFGAKKNRKSCRKTRKSRKHSKR